MAAAVLVRALGDWRRAVPPRMRPEDFAVVEEAMAALRLSAAEWAAGVQRERLPAGGSGEGQRQSAAPSSEEWITTRDAAALLGLKPRRVRQLAEQGKLDSQKVDGRLYFRRTQVCSRAQTRAS